MFVFLRDDIVSGFFDRRVHLFEKSTIVAYLERMSDSENIKRCTVIDVELIVVHVPCYAVIVFGDEAVCRLKSFEDF